jgi:hypothetical protein
VNAVVVMSGVKAFMVSWFGGTMGRVDGVDPREVFSQRAYGQERWS